VAGVIDGKPVKPGASATETILLRNSKGVIQPVDLGPTWYLQGMQTKLRVGDKVSVTGSKVFEEGRSVILAQKVTRRNKALYVREMNGTPMWVAYHEYKYAAPVSVAGTPNPPPISATVQSVATVTDPQTGQQNSVLVVNTPQGPMDVNLGPQWFISHQGVQFANGDNITFAGMQVAPVPGMNGVFVPTYFAPNYVTNGNNTLVLRNSYGLPVWNPWTNGR